MSLFTVESERWALNLHLLISLDPTDGFECHDLQVRALIESHLFGCLLSRFGYPEALHEQFGVSWRQVTLFEGKGATWSHLWGIFERLGRSFFPNRCDLAFIGCILMIVVAKIRVFACVGWMRSSCKRKTAKTSRRNHYKKGM